MKGKIPPHINLLAWVVLLLALLVEDAIQVCWEQANDPVSSLCTPCGVDLFIHYTTSHTDFVISFCLSGLLAFVQFTNIVFLQHSWSHLSHFRSQKRSYLHHCCLLRCTGNEFPSYAVLFHAIKMSSSDWLSIPLNTPNTSKIKRPYLLVDFTRDECSIVLSWSSLRMLSISLKCNQSSAMEQGCIHLFSVKRIENTLPSSLHPRLCLRLQCFCPW